MWRFRSVAILGTLAGVLIFGAVVAHGGWSWNAQLAVEGMDVRTSWTVLDDPDGASAYFTDIKVSLPPQAVAAVVAYSANETVQLGQRASLACLPNGIEAVFEFQVRPLAGADGKTVAVTVTANGVVVGQDSGVLNQNIVMLPVNTVIPATCSGS